MNILTEKEVKELVEIIETKNRIRSLNNFKYTDNSGKPLTEEEINEQEWLDNVQTVLDYAGLVPVYGDAIDVINAIIYFARAGFEGKFMPNGMNGLFSLVAVIPVVGSALSIPLKAAFKALPVAAATKVIRELLQGSGTKAAKEMMEGATTSNSKKALTELQSFIVKNTDKILKGTKILKRTIGALAVIPLTKVDDKLAAFGIAAIKRFEDFVKTLGGKNVEVVGKIVKGKLSITSIPAGKLTKRGRIATTGFGIRRAGARRMFYASQDMFADYLKKEGRSVLSKEANGALVNQTVRNLNGGRMLAKGETIETFMKKVGEDRFSREFTNLAIVNESKLFDDFLSSASANQRAERFMKTLTDPSVYRDARGWFGTVRKKGFKLGIAAFAKSHPDDDEYRQERDQDKFQDDLTRGDKEKKVSGKRNM